jgi:hypothetical protein
VAFVSLASFIHLRNKVECAGNRLSELLEIICHFTTGNFLVFQFSFGNRFIDRRCHLGKRLVKVLLPKLVLKDIQVMNLLIPCGFVELELVFFVDQRLVQPRMVKSDAHVKISAVNHYCRIQARRAQFGVLEFRKLSHLQI